MDMFEYTKALADLWTMGGKMFLPMYQNPGAGGEAPPGMTWPQASGLPNLSGETAELTRANQAMVELWSAAGALARTIVGRMPGAGSVDPTVEATFHKMLDPRAWLTGAGEIEELLRSMAEGPRLADLWDVERRYARVFRAWLNLRRCSLEHNAAALEGWLRAGREFAARTSGKSQRDATDPDALLAQWIETANRELIATQRSERFLHTQAALIRASTELKAAQRDLLEYYGERFGFPTRTELDDVYRTVTELRRELRALQRQRRREAEQPAPAPSRSPRAARARSRS